MVKFSFRPRPESIHFDAMWNLYGDILGWRCIKCKREYWLEPKCSKVKHRKVLAEVHACCKDANDELVKMEEGE